VGHFFFSTKPNYPIYDVLLIFGINNCCWCSRRSGWRLLEGRPVQEAAFQICVCPVYSDHGIFSYFSVKVVQFFSNWIKYF